MTGYIIKNILCSGLLLLFYYLFLEREKMIRFNRAFLLFSIIFSLIVPLITLPAGAKANPVLKTLSWPQEMVIEQQRIIPDAGSAQIIVTEQTTPVGPKVAWICYLLITAFLLYRFVKNLLSLFIKIKKNKVIVYSNAKLVLTEAALPSYSFLNYIFLNKEAFEKGSIEKEILQHELTHVQQKHSLDILALELIMAIVWFNPFLFLYRKAIGLNHEFLADAGVIKHDTGIRAYQLLLLQHAGNNRVQLTSSFNYLITKKRLLMMNRQTSPAAGAAKITAACIILAATILFFSTKVISQQTPAKITEPQVSPEYKDTIRSLPVWVGKPIGATPEGIDEYLMDKYKNILDKYDLKGDKMKFDFFKITAADRDKLEYIFSRMSKIQQAQQNVIFIESQHFLPKTVPTKAQFESYKNAKVYGVWLNEKKVDNAVLDNYKNTDFANFFTSKLYGAAKKGRSYSVQVNLMTNSYYKNYKDKEGEHNKKPDMVYIGKELKTTN